MQSIANKAHRRLGVDLITGLLWRDFIGAAVPVDSVADLPEPVAGVINLAPLAHYHFREMVDLGSKVIHLSVAGNTLTGCYSIGSDPTGFFTSSSSPAVLVDAAITGGVRMEHLRIVQNGTGQVVHCSGAGKLNRWEAEFCTFESASTGALGSIHLGTAKLYRCFSTAVKDGWMFSGTSNLELENCVMLQTDGAGGKALLDLGASVFTTLRLSKCSLQTAAGGFAIKGLANSANLSPTSGICEVVESRHSGVGTALGTLTPQDIGFEYRSCFGFRNTATVGSTEMNDNATGNTFGGLGTYSLVAGASSLEAGAPRFTTNGGLSHTLKFVGRHVSPARVSVSVVFTKAGGAQDYSIGLFKGGVMVHDITIAAGPADSRSANFVHIDEAFASDDVYDVRVAALTATDTLTVVSCGLIVQLLA